MEVLTGAALAVIGLVLVGHIAVPPVRYAVWLASYSMLAGWIGYAVIRSDSGGPGLWQQSIAIPLFGLGAFLAMNSAPPVRQPRSRRSPSARAGSIVLGGMTVLCLYHFWRIGVPITSGNVDLARWNITGSGLGGLPGRAYLIGLPFVMAYAIVAANRSGEVDRAAWCRVRNVSIIVVVVTRVAGGFKGELLEMVVLIALAALISARTVHRVPKGLRGRLVVCVAVAIGAAALISTQYAATRYHQQNEGLSVTDQLVRRMTVMVVDSGSYLIDLADSDDRLVPGTSVVNDFHAYLGRNFGLWDAEGEFSVNERLSARMNGRSVLLGRHLTFDRFVVPVTPGFAAVSYHDFGWAGVVLAALGLGVALATMVRRGLTASSTTTTFTSVAAVEIIRQFVQKGDLPYLVTNYALVAVGVVAGLHAVDRLVTGAIRRHPVDVVGPSAYVA